MMDHTVAAAVDGYGLGLARALATAIPGFWRYAPDHLGWRAAGPWWRMATRFEERKNRCHAVVRECCFAVCSAPKSEQGANA